MRLGDLRPNPGAKRRKKRVGRGPGSGHGKTATRGHKGQKSRSGGVKDPRRFEGGRSTLLMRLPKRGMPGQVPGEIRRPRYQGVNLKDLARFEGEVTPKRLVEAGVLKKGHRLKILGEGEAKPLRVLAHAFSKSALEKLKAAGGEPVLLEPEKASEA